MGRRHTSSHWYPGVPTCGDKQDLGLGIKGWSVGEEIRAAPLGFPHHRASIGERRACLHSQGGRGGPPCHQACCGHLRSPGWRHHPPGTGRGEQRLWGTTSSSLGVRARGQSWAHLEGLHLCSGRFWGSSLRSGQAVWSLPQSLDTRCGWPWISL